MVYEYLFLTDKKIAPPKDIVSLLLGSKYHQNHVAQLQSGRHILSGDYCIIWLGLRSQGGPDTTIMEKMSENVK